MSGLQGGYLYAAPIDFDPWRRCRPIEITAYAVPMPEPCSPPPVWIPTGGYTNQKTVVGEPKNPNMLDLCKQRRDELKAELETLEAMIAAAEKAGGK